MRTVNASDLADELSIRLVDDHDAILTADENAMVARIGNDVVPAPCAADRIRVRDAIGATRLRGDVLRESNGEYDGRSAHFFLQEACSKIRRAERSVHRHSPHCCHLRVRHGRYAWTKKGHPPMRIEVIAIAFVALRANVLRSVLTMLGVIIGVAAVIAMIALGDGAQQSVRDRITKLGTTTLQIDAQWVRLGGIQTNIRKRVTTDDVKAIEERAPHVLAVEPQQDKDLQLLWRDRNASVKIVGATANFALV